MLTKVVNGVEVQCKPEEEDSLRAEWAVNDPALRPPKAAAMSAEQLVEILKAKKLLTDADMVALSTDATA